MNTFKKQNNQTDSVEGSTSAVTELQMEEDSMMPSTSTKTNAEAIMNASADDMDNMDTDQVIPKKRRMTNGQKKRLHKMIAGGKSFAEAIEVIREEEKSMSSNSNKRQRSDDSPPVNPPKRKAGMSYRDAVTGIKVAITAANFPEVELTLEQLNKVDDAIMNAVEAIPLDGIRVSFSYCSYKPGYMILTCVNEESKKWITSTIPTLTPWEGAKLKCMDGDDLPKPFIHLVWIPGQVEITPKSILERMMRQNEGMCTTNWVVVNDLKNEKGHTLTVSVDAKSEKYLKERDYSVYLRFGKVTFRPKGKPIAKKPIETSTATRMVLKPSSLSKTTKEGQANSGLQNTVRPTLGKKQRVDSERSNSTSSQADVMGDIQYLSANRAQHECSESEGEELL